MKRFVLTYAVAAQFLAGFTQVQREGLAKVSKPCVRPSARGRPGFTLILCFICLLFNPLPLARTFPEQMTCKVPWLCSVLAISLHFHRKYFKIKVPGTPLASWLVAYPDSGFEKSLFLVYAFSFSGR